MSGHTDWTDLRNRHLAEPEVAKEYVADIVAHEIGQDVRERHSRRHAQDPDYVRNDLDETDHKAR
jgi:hypothetical protein